MLIKILKFKQNEQIFEMNEKNQKLSNTNIEYETKIKSLQKKLIK